MYKFLKGLEEEWITKQKNVASKYAEISRRKEVTIKKTKKRKTKGNVEPLLSPPERFSNLAAQLQVDFIVKVHLENVFQLLLHFLHKIIITKLV
jgi:hypothetical protein